MMNGLSAAFGFGGVPWSLLALSPSTSPTPTLSALAPGTFEAVSIRAPFT